MNTDYPNDSDGDALRRVMAGGSDMFKPMDIDFHVAAPDEDTAKRVADEFAKLGYRISIWFDDLDGERASDAWTCQCTKIMVPSYKAIITAQAELNAVAQPLGAYADGWGTFGNAANPACMPNTPQP